MANAFTYIKYVYSMILLIFSLVIVMALIATENTKLSRDIHPALAYVVIWVGIIWLTMIEGGQASLVGLPPVDRDLYLESHPVTHQICSMCHKGDNLDRYLVGRQFMVVLTAFCINMAGGPLKGATVFGLPDVIIQIFLGSGLAMILMTASIGQLPPQVNASHCMLDYINTHFMTFTFYVAMSIEFSGLLHSTYLIQYIFAGLSGKPIDSKEPPRDAATALFFWGRVLMSCVILGFSFVVTLTALFQGKTTMWEGVPPFVSVIIFFFLLTIIGTLEGMQIAFFAVTKLPAEERGNHKFAMMTCELLFKGEGMHLPGFMIGRQICVTMCFFIVARITSLNIDVKAGDATIFGVPDGVQEFFNTGLLGAICTTIVGSIMWQLVASAFPVGFMCNPIVYILLRWCLFLEATGICSAAWVNAMILKKIIGYQHDEVYVGTPEERAAKKKPDAQVDVNAGHMYPGVPLVPHPVGAKSHSMEG